jgi:hypothetical protein
VHKRSTLPQSAGFDKRSRAVGFVWSPIAAPTVRMIKSLERTVLAVIVCFVISFAHEC